MISVEEAVSIIRQKCCLIPDQETLLPLIKPGMILAESIVGNEDLPPFDKALMDGYAVRSADAIQSLVHLEVIEEITAGQVPQKTIASGQASRIMTGAPVPPGADAVVPVEMTTLHEQRVSLNGKAPTAGWNVLKKGGEIKRGDILLHPGAILRPQEIALLATVGRESVKVIPKPRVAILCTGDELVEVGNPLQPGQIRNSNGPMLGALVLRAGAVPIGLGIATDRIDSLTARIKEGLQESVLILSGGVSAGKLDLVPEVLQSLGVKTHFHKVAMKPGKPVLFGTLDAVNGNGQRKYVFGLPGNPVSALVCFELFVRPALGQLARHQLAQHSPVSALLTHEHFYSSDRPIYHPANLKIEPSGWKVDLVPWLGSSDLRGLLKANSLALLPAGKHQFGQGESLSVILMDREISSVLD